MPRKQVKIELRRQREQEAEKYLGNKVQIK